MPVSPPVTICVFTRDTPGFLPEEITPGIYPFRLSLGDIIEEPVIMAVIYLSSGQ
jgi:hypothetical protein